MRRDAVDVLSKTSREAQMQLDKDDIEELMENIGATLENIDIYVSSGKVLLGRGKKIVKKFRPLLTDVVNELMQLGIDLHKDVKPQLAAISLITAQSRFQDYQNYKNAGFSAAQSFVLVLASVKPVNFSEMLSSVSKSLSKK